MIRDSTQLLQEIGSTSRGMIAGLPGSALIVVDTDFRIAFADGELCQPSFVGRPVSDILPARGWEFLRPRYQNALRGQEQSFEYKNAQSRSTFAMQLKPVHDGGEVVGVLVSAYDITAGAVVRDALTAGERRHRAVFEALAEGVIVTDLDGRLLDANEAACSILGFDLDAALDDPSWWSPFGAHLSGDEAPLEEAGAGATVVATGRGLRGVRIELVRTDGTPLSLSLNYLPWRGPSDEVGGLVLSFHDVTRSELERRQLVETEARLRDAHEVARLASWQWNPGEDTVTVFQALGENVVKSGSETRLADLLAVLPAGDREAAREALEAMVRGQRNEAVTRFRRGSPSSPVWIELRARAVRDVDGRLVCVRGTSQDVSEQELAAREIASARDFVQSTLDSLPAHVAVLDESGAIVKTNSAWKQFALDNGGTPSGVDTNYLTAWCPDVGDELAARVADGLRAVASGACEDFSIEYPCQSPSAERWFVLRASRYEGRGEASVVVVHNDVTARHKAQAEASTQAALLDEVDVAVIATDHERRVIHWNRAAEELYGWSREEAVGELTSALAAVDGEPTAAQVFEELRRDGSWEGEFVVARKDGTKFPAGVRIRTILDDEGSLAGMISVSFDATKRIAADGDLRSARDYMRAVADSMGDGLCTLDNKGRIVYVNHRAEELLGWTSADLAGRDLHEALHHTRPDGSPYPPEESPLVAARLTGQPARTDDDVLVCRSGTLLPVQLMLTPFETDDGVGGFVLVFSDISARKGQEHDAERKLVDLAWIERIRDALDHDRLVLYAQPIVEIASNRTTQHELLLRMLDNDGTPIPPALFLPVAENYGSIGEIDRWVTRETFALAAAGHAVEMNVSAHSLSDPAFYDFVENELRGSGADPALIVFELTETALVHDQVATENFANRIHSLGCRLALDDFGTGYGGFTYLKQLPIDFLKIDIEFVRDLATDPASRLVVESVVALARSFDLETVAEGVEDARTLEMLREYGVDYAQGYHCGRPAPLEERLRQAG
jgi:PAS domain S-box-containing protein